MDIRIEIPKPEDALDIQNVFYKTWLATYPNEGAGITVDDIEDSYKDDFSPEKIAELKEILSKPIQDKLRLVAKINGKIVGCGTMIRRDADNMLRALYVLPEYQGKGIGTMLWNEMYKFSDKTKDTILLAAEYNLSAINFYKKHGFIDTGKRILDEKLRMKSGSIIPEIEMVLKHG